MRRMDQGTHFTAQVLQKTLKGLGVTQILWCAYRPQTQGAIERSHQTLKTMLKTFVLEHQRDWAVALPFLMFAAQSCVHSSLGYSSFQLVYGHFVRRPLQLLLKDLFTHKSVTGHTYAYVSKMKDRLRSAIDVARRALEDAQADMKDRYDVKSVTRHFKPCDQVLLLLPMQGDPMHVTLSGP